MVDYLVHSSQAHPFEVLDKPVPCFLGYKTEFFSLPQNLDPSHKTELDLWDCLGRVKLVL